MPRRPRDIDFTMLRTLRTRYGAAYPRGRVIFNQGDANTEFYVVLQGEVDMIAVDSWSHKRMIVRRFGPGEFFGEMACFLEQPRSATAVAASDAVLLSFSQSAARELLVASPKFALGVIQGLCDRMLEDGHLIAKLAASGDAAHKIWEAAVNQSTSP